MEQKTEPEPAVGASDPSSSDSEPTPIEEETQERHFLVLMVTIVSIALAQVILGPTLTDSRLVGGLQLIVIGVTIYAVGGRRNLTIAALILGGPVIIARLVSVSITTREAEFVSHSLGLVFMAYVIWVIARAVARPGRVTMDKIYGAVCLYLLLGLLWGYAYTILEIAHPGSFSFPEQATPQALVEQSDYRDLERELNYFSYVTLTTLGYGDITPRTGRARQLSWMEAMLGQLFIAITVARLVGAHIASSSGKDS
jgi:hypothetical protein